MEKLFKTSLNDPVHADQLNLKQVGSIIEIESVCVAFCNGFELQLYLGTERFSCGRFKNECNAKYKELYYFSSLSSVCHRVRAFEIDTSVFILLALAQVSGISHDLNSHAFGQQRLSKKNVERY